MDKWQNGSGKQASINWKNTTYPYKHSRKKIGSQDRCKTAHLSTLRNHLINSRINNMLSTSKYQQVKTINNKELIFRYLHVNNMGKSYL